MAFIQLSTRSSAAPFPLELTILVFPFSHRLFVGLALRGAVHQLTPARTSPTQGLLAGFQIPNRASGPDIDDVGHQAGPGCSALAVPMDRLWLLCREVPPGGPLTGQVVDHLDELAWLVFRRDHVIAAIGGAAHYHNSYALAPGSGTRLMFRKLIHAEPVGRVHLSCDTPSFGCGYVRGVSGALC
jgi:hypothetical protein